MTVSKKTYLNAKKIFCLLFYSQIKQSETCCLSRIKHVRYRDEISLSNRKTTTKFAKSKNNSDEMIAFVDRTVNDKKNVRISTNIYCRWCKLSKQLWIINEKKIDANLNTYRSARRVRDFTSFADFAIISFTDWVVLDTKNT